jgi:hypothetical protein
MLQRNHRENISLFAFSFPIVIGTVVHLFNFSRRKANRREMFKIIYLQKRILQEETEKFSFGNQLIFSKFLLLVPSLGQEALPFPIQNTLKMFEIVRDIDLTPSVL